MKAAWHFSPLKKKNKTKQNKKAAILTKKEHSWKLHTSCLQTTLQSYSDQKHAIDTMRDIQANGANNSLTYGELTFNSFRECPKEGCALQ